MHSLMKQSTGQELEGDMNPLIVYELLQGYSTDRSLIDHAHKPKLKSFATSF